jgi:hypothetical protein
MLSPLSYVLMAASLATVVPVPGSATSRHADPDWPCPQRLVLKLSPQQFWSGSSPAPSGDWHSDPRVTALVEKIIPRRVDADAGTALIEQFAGEASGDRGAVLGLAFVGVLEETNRQRSELIERIQALARRQRELSEIAVTAGEALRAIPEDATGEAAARRQDLENRRRFVSKAFEDTQRTMRYACEAPVQLESRLGVYTRALQSALE